MKRTHLALTILITVLTVCLLGGSTVISVFADGVWLPSTEDAGEEYQRALIFFGESTTAHLKSRAVLANGTQTEQVWTTPKGTMLLSSKTAEQAVILPKTGEMLPFSRVLRQEQPAYLVLSFGLNGIVGFDKDPDSYLRHYRELIDCIQRESPRTSIILQTVYPVTAARDAELWHFSATAEEINQMIERINQRLPTLAKSRCNVRIADTASVLKDENGQLRADYATEDGIHLRASAYRAILSYLRTHACHAPTPLPITPDQWRTSE